LNVFLHPGSLVSCQNFHILFLYFNRRSSREEYKSNGKEADTMSRTVTVVALVGSKFSHVLHTFNTSSYLP
jgi:hypothetical protein